MLQPTILRRESIETHGELEYSLSPDAALILMADGNARILDMGSRFYSVPAVAAMFLQETLQHGPTAAVQRVMAEYDVAKSQADADLREFLAALVDRGVLERHHGVSAHTSEGATAVTFAVIMLRRIVAILPSLTARAIVLLTATRFLIGLFGWTRTVSTLRRQFPLRTNGLPAHEAGAAARAIDEAVCSAAAWNPFGVACKERGLTCWTLARISGLPATLVIGIELYPLSGHCWCEAGSTILSDHADNCMSYLPAICYQ